MKMSLIRKVLEHIELEPESVDMSCWVKLRPLPKDGRYMAWEELPEGLREFATGDDGSIDLNDFYHLDAWSLHGEARGWKPEKPKLFRGVVACLSGHVVMTRLGLHEDVRGLLLRVLDPQGPTLGRQAQQMLNITGMQAEAMFRRRFWPDEEWLASQAVRLGVPAARSKKARRKLSESHLLAAMLRSILEGELWLSSKGNWMVPQGEKRVHLEDVLCEA